jgi:imidazolonepropionase-like amidohydrolase
MHLRVVLRTPGGETVIRDTLDGIWVEPWGVPDEITPSDLWALPGLVDAHAHLGRSSNGLLSAGVGETGANARTALAAGVGLVIDKGWVDLRVIEMIEQVPQGERPIIEAAGVILAVEDGYWAGMGRDVGPGRVSEEVERAAREGSGWVKMIGDWPRKGIGPVANFTEADLKEAVEVARANGAKVAVHTMAREVPSMAVGAGVDSIEHGLFLSADDLGVLGERSGIWVPTVTQVESLIEELGAGSSGGRLLTEGLENVAAHLAVAVEAGVRVLTGTDLAIRSHEVAREALRLWDMGMRPEAVIDAVSWSGYLATGRSDRFGVGEEADAVLFAEDPIANPGVLAFPSNIVRRGRLVA